MNKGRPVYLLRNRVGDPLPRWSIYRQLALFSHWLPTFCLLFFFFLYFLWNPLASLGGRQISFFFTRVQICSLVNMCLFYESLNMQFRKCVSFINELDIVLGWSLRALLADCKRAMALIGGGEGPSVWRPSPEWFFGGRKTNIFKLFYGAYPEPTNVH